MARLAILGAGGHAKVVADAALSSGSFGEIFFFDDGNPQQLVVGSTEDLLKAHGEFDGVVVAIGDNSVRHDKYELLRSSGVSIATVVHSSAVIAASAVLGAGCVVFAGTVVNPDARIAENSILNTRCVVDHDCILESSVHIGPNVALGGGVQLGTRSWIGIGATVKHGVSISANVLIGAGAVVVKNISEPGIYAGVPAHQL